MPDTRLTLGKTPNAGIPAVREGVHKVKRGTTQAWIATGPIGEPCQYIPGRNSRGADNGVRYVTIREGCHIVIATVRGTTGGVEVYRVRSVETDDASPVANVTLSFSVPITYHRPAFREAAGYDSRFERAVECAVCMTTWPREYTYTLSRR